MIVPGQKETKYIVVGTSAETGMGVTVAHMLSDLKETTSPVVMIDMGDLSKTELRKKVYEITEHPRLEPLFFSDVKPPHKGARRARQGNAYGNCRTIVINKHKKKQARKARKQTRKKR